MASRAKRRKLAAVAAAPRSDAARVADVTYRELYNALTMLGQLQKKQHAELELLAENIAEVSLRVRYIMQHFKFERGSRMLGLDGQPIPGEIATLFDRYNAERAPFLASLARELTDAQTSDPHPGAKSGEPAAADAGRINGHDVDAAEAHAVATGRALTLAHSS